MRQDYRPWRKVRIIAGRESLEAELAWMMLKLGRRQNARGLPFTSVEGETLWYTLPDSAQQELMLIDQQLAGRIGIDDDAAPSAEQRDRFVINALMEEAIASSQIEGAATTRRVAKDMLRQGRPPRNVSERMIVNNYRAISRIHEHTDTPLTPEFLLDLQRILTEGTLKREDEVGRFRLEGENVRVESAYGELLHEPPPAHELEDRIAAICRFANREPVPEEQFIHPVVRAIILHFQIAYDHPFCDGNGRTARAVFYWSLLRAGYWLFEFLPVSRLIRVSPSKYAMAFLDCETDEFDATYFLLYNLRIIARARSGFAQYLRAKQRETRRAREVFASDPSLNHRQHAVLMHALQHPDAMYTIESHQNSHRIAYGTARSDLLKLSDSGYLTRQQAGKQFIFIPGPRLTEFDSVY